jgi:predicted ATPase/DNA-binding SARP family transcriptional activator
MGGGELEFRMLGPLEVIDSGRSVSLGAPKQRALLAVLLLHANEPVSADVLIDALWDDEAPETAVTSVHGYVSRLRRLLGSNAIATEARGYRVHVGPDALDTRRFEHLVERGGEALAAGRADVAAEALQQGLELWRGPALADFRYESFAQAEAARLDELRLTALEERIEAGLELGRAGELIGELNSLVAEHPLRERLRRHLMIALYRSGRQAEALAAYKDARETLADLGLDPSRELQELERAILNQDPSLTRISDTARPTGPRPPSFSTPLVGRQAELAAMRLALLDPGVRLLTLTGPGGAGKTRLALELLHGVGAEYADGAVFVPLAPVTDPDLIIPAIAQAAGVMEVSGETLETTLEAHLRHRHVLLVLDNFEQLTAAAARLPGLLSAGPRVQLLVTSRAPLRLSGEHEFAVPSLERSDAVALLVERARAVRPEFDPSADDEALLSEICDRLDDLPLAIELAAARVKLLSPRAMLARLEKRLGLLTGGPRDLPQRQQTLRATLDWSYGLLEPQEQRAFARLAVFVGGATLDAAEEVCGDDLEVFESVSSLVDKNLLRSSEQADGEPRIRMLHIIREYALERLRESPDHDELVRRHAEYYAALAKRAAPELIRAEQAAWFERLAHEHDNFRAALAWLLERPEADPPLELAGSLWRYWETRGHLTEGANWLERALAHEGAAKPGTTATALLGAGCLAHSRGEYEDAITFHERAAGLYEELGEPRGLAWSLNNLGLVFTNEGRLDRAAELHEQSLALAREIGEEWLIASSLINLANVAFFKRDYDRAEVLQEEGRRLSGELGDEWRVGLACLNLGWIHIGQGDTERASARLCESIELFRRLRERRWLPDALEGLAAVAAETGQAERAARLFGAADGIRASINAPVGESERAIYEPFLARAREELGATAFEEAGAAGRVMTPEQAVSLALENTIVLSP